MLAAVSHFFKPSAPDPQIRTGAVYRRSTTPHLVEIAEVIDVYSDSQGIPHVRYNVKLKHDQEKIAAFPERRILNLKTFSTEFFEASDS